MGYVSVSLRLTSACQDSSSEQTNVDSVKEEQGEKKAEGIRYGQNVSESGMGGMTNTSTGDANQGRLLTSIALCWSTRTLWANQILGGYGKTEEQSGQDTDMSMRREQGYGGGSGVGA